MKYTPEQKVQLVNLINQYNQTSLSPNDFDIVDHDTLPTGEYKVILMDKSGDTTYFLYEKIDIGQITPYGFTYLSIKDPILSSVDLLPYINKKYGLEMIDSDIVDDRIHYTEVLLNPVYAYTLHVQPDSLLYTGELKLYLSPESKVIGENVYILTSDTNPILSIKRYHIDSDEVFDTSFMVFDRFSFNVYSPSSILHIGDSIFLFGNFEFEEIQTGVSYTANLIVLDTLLGDYIGSYTNELETYLDNIVYDKDSSYLYYHNIDINGQIHIKRAFFNGEIDNSYDIPIDNIDTVFYMDVKEDNLYIAYIPLGHPNKDIFIVKKMDTTGYVDKSIELSLQDNLHNKDVNIHTALKDLSIEGDTLYLYFGDKNSVYSIPTDQVLFDSTYFPTVNNKRLIDKYIQNSQLEYAYIPIIKLDMSLPITDCINKVYQEGLFFLPHTDYTKDIVYDTSSPHNVVSDTKLIIEDNHLLMLTNRKNNLGRYCQMFNKFTKQYGNLLSTQNTNSFMEVVYKVINKENNLILLCDYYSFVNGEFYKLYGVIIRYCKDTMLSTIAYNPSYLSILDIS